MAGVLQHLRSSTLNKRPNPASMVDGQIAINYASGSPGAFFKDTNGNLVKVGPVHVGATAPNVSPASGGTAGNSLGEQWLDTSGGTYVFKIWDGAAWRSEAGEFVNSTGDTMTGSLTMGPSANLIFEGSTDDGFETTLTVVDPTADRTITLPNVSGTVVTTGDSGTVTSTMIADGTIVNADVNASAAIAGTKISPDFGSQTIQTTGIFSHAVGSAGAPTIAFTGDTNTGIYSPGADQVAIGTGGSGRLFVDSNGRVGVATSAPTNSLEVVGGATSNLFAVKASSSGDCLSVTARSAGNGAIVSALNSAQSDYAPLELNGQFIYFQTRTGTGTVSERARIDSSGRLLVGTSSARSNFHDSSSYSPRLQLESANNGANSSIALVSVSGGGFDEPNLVFAKSRGSAIGDNTIVASGDDIGNISFQASDGSEFVVAANILAEVDGTPGANDMPGRLVFSTTADGASSPTERLRIDSSGRLLVGTSSAIDIYTGLQVKAVQPAAAAYLDLQASFASTITGQGAAIIRFLHSDNAYRAHILCESDGASSGSSDAPGRLVFSTTADGASSPTERMRIRNTGQVWINQTANGYGVSDTTILQVTAGGPDYVSSFYNTNASPYGLFVRHDTDSNNTSNLFIQLTGGTTTRAQLRSNGGLANYQANDVNLSDINTKKDISPAADTWDCIKEWEIVNYRYKDQPDDADLNLGVIAQQVAESCPEVITVFEEAKDSQPEKLGVKEQQMYWMAIKALQEAQVRIETLEAKVAALESA